MNVIGMYIAGSLVDEEVSVLYLDAARILVTLQTLEKTGDGSDPSDRPSKPSKGCARICSEGLPPSRPKPLAGRRCGRDEVK